MSSSWPRRYPDYEEIDGCRSACSSIWATIRPQPSGSATHISSRGEISHGDGYGLRPAANTNEPKTRVPSRSRATFVKPEPWRSSSSPRSRKIRKPCGAYERRSSRWDWLADWLVTPAHRRARCPVRDPESRRFLPAQARVRPAERGRMARASVGRGLDLGSGLRQRGGREAVALGVFLERKRLFPGRVGRGAQ